MNAASSRVQRIYLILLLLHTLAASFIWGINTLFLLDAGLSNTQAFAANAFFTAGLVLFEVPTGVIADMRGRRRLVSARHADADDLHPALSADVAHLGAVLGVGGQLRVSRSRLHVLLRRRSRPGWSMR